jgi:hypothetical protein
LLVPLQAIAVRLALKLFEVINQTLVVSMAQSVSAFGRQKKLVHFNSKPSLLSFCETIQVSANQKGKTSVASSSASNSSSPWAEIISAE